MESTPTARPKQGHKKPLVDLGDQPIAFHPVLAKIGGSVVAGLFMSQVLYWRSVMGRAFYKTHEDWTAETCLTAKQLRAARAKWRQLGVLKEKLRGTPAKLWFDVDVPRLKELLAASAIAPKSAEILQFGQKGKLDVPKGQTCSAERANSSETTTETTKPETSGDSDVPSESTLDGQRPPVPRPEDAVGHLRCPPQRLRRSTRGNCRGKVQSQEEREDAIFLRRLESRIKADNVTASEVDAFSWRYEQITDKYRSVTPLGGWAYRLIQEVAAFRDPDPAKPRSNSYFDPVSCMWVPDDDDRPSKAERKPYGGHHP